MWELNDAVIDVCFIGPISPVTRLLSLHTLPTVGIARVVLIYIAIFHIFILRGFTDTAVGKLQYVLLINVCL